MWIFGYGSLVWKADFPFTKKIVGYIKGYERKFWQASVDHRGTMQDPGRVVTLIPSDDPDTKVWGTAYKIHRKDVESVVHHLDLREIGGYVKTPVEFYPVPHHKLNLYEVSSSTSLKSSNSGLTINEDGNDHHHHHKNGRNGVSSSSSSTTNGFSDKKVAVTQSKANGINGVKSSHPHQSNDKSASPANDHIHLSESESEAEDEVNDILEGSVEHGHFRVIMYYGNSDNIHFIGPASVEDMATQIFECHGVSGTNKEYLYNLSDSMRQISDEANDLHLRELENRVRKLEALATKTKSGRSTPIEL